MTADREPRDPDGRFLVYAWTPTGLLLNLDQARLGHGKAREIWLNVARSGEIAAAVFDAHRAGRGLWAPAGDTNPCALTVTVIAGGRAPPRRTVTVAAW
ncbi:MAG TPA: hypothetical protein VI011_22590 [Asanoa sp.]